MKEFFITDGYVIFFRKTRRASRFFDGSPRLLPGAKIFTIEGVYIRVPIDEGAAEGLKALRNKPLGRPKGQKLTELLQVIPLYRWNAERV